MITLEIDINRLKENAATLKQRTDARLYAVVKANAYGHGAELCRYIQDMVYGFAVFYKSEAQELIALGIKNPILILCPSQMLNNSPQNIIYSVCSLKDLTSLSNCNVAIKINTGMNRLGADKSNYSQILNELQSRKDLTLTEVFTHFYSPDGAKVQFDRFISASGNISNKILRHCCSSAFLRLPKKMHLDAVRSGLALYGYSSLTKPILSAYTRVAQINYVKKGNHIGYGDITADKNTKIAVLKAGYADGLKRVAGHTVRIGGRECKIIGSVCMDMCMADVTGFEVQQGDKAYLIDDVLTAEVLASRQNTIPYEILTAFSSSRIKRVYTGTKENQNEGDKRNF